MEMEMFEIGLPKQNILPLSITSDFMSLNMLIFQFPSDDSKTVPRRSDRRSQPNIGLLNDGISASFLCCLQSHIPD